MLTAAVVAVFAYLGRDYLVDSWWIWKLRSADRTARNLAAQKLAERKCLRAVPDLVKVIDEDIEEAITEVEAGDSYKTDTYRIGTPLIYALWSMGEEALPAIEQQALRLTALRDPPWRVLNILDDLQDRSLRMRAETAEDRAMWLRAISGE